jgi:O-antigen/teichoic acid export membrane protein
MLNPLRILRSSSKITVVAVISAALNFPLSVFVARATTPDQLGQINFVTLWLTYANLVSLGLFAGGQREMIHRLGRRETELAYRAQNTAFSTEMLWALLPAIVILLSSSLFPEPLKKWGLVLVSATYLLATANKLLANLHLAHQRFELYARFTLVRVLIPPVLIVIFISALGPLTLLLAPLLAEGVLLALYLARAPRLELRPDFNRPRTWAFMQAGFPLALAGFIYWAYRLTGQTSVAVWFPVEALAFYGFSANLVTLITRAFGDFASVLTPILWKELSQSGASHALHRETSRISLFLIIATGAIASLAQAGFAPLLQLILPAYAQSIPVFEVLSLNIIVLTMTFVPSLVLDSTLVNKQWLHLSIWAVGLALDLGFNYLAARAGGGLLAIAWNDIWIQLLVVMALYAAAQPHLYPARSFAFRVYLSVGLLLLVEAAVFALLRLPAFASEPPLTLVSSAAALGLRVALVLAVWGTIGFIFARTAVLDPAK